MEAERCYWCREKLDPMGPGVVKRVAAWSEGNAGAVYYRQATGTYAHKFCMEHKKGDMSDLSRQSRLV